MPKNKIPADDLTLFFNFAGKKFALKCETEARA